MAHPIGQYGQISQLTNDHRLEMNYSIFQIQIYGSGEMVSAGSIKVD